MGNNETLIWERNINNLPVGSVDSARDFLRQNPLPPSIASNPEVVKSIAYALTLYKLCQEERSLLKSCRVEQRKDFTDSSNSFDLEFMNTKFADILGRLFDNNHKVLPAGVGKIKNSERLELMKYINDSLIPNYTAFLYPEYKTAKK